LAIVERISFPQHAHGSLNEALLIRRAKENHLLEVAWDEILLVVPFENPRTLVEIKNINIEERILEVFAPDEPGD
jgi:hypothetical protein